MRLLLFLLLLAGCVEPGFSGTAHAPSHRELPQTFTLHLESEAREAHSRVLLEGTYRYEGGVLIAGERSRYSIGIFSSERCEERYENGEWPDRCRTGLPRLATAEDVGEALPAMREKTPFASCRGILCYGLSEG